MVVEVDKKGNSRERMEKTKGLEGSALKVDRD